MNRFSFHSPVRMAYVQALFIIGTLGTLITPALFESWSALHWTQGQLGIVAGIELAGLGLGSASGLYWQRRWSWRQVTIASLVTAAFATLACIGLTSYSLVCVARAVAGLAGGTLSAVYSAYAANLRAPLRLIATTTFVQIALEALFIFGAPSLFATMGSNAIFGVMALLLVALVPLFRGVPPRWPDACTDVTDDVPVHTSWHGYPLLFAFLPYTLIQAGVYAFLGKFAQYTAHLRPDESLRVVGISVIFSSVGAVVAYVMDDQHKLKVPITVTSLVMGLSLCAISLWTRTGSQFLLASAALQIGWTLLNCLLYSALIYANNLLVPAATTVSCVGSAVGAWMVGEALEAHGTIGALALCSVALVATAASSVPFIAVRGPAVT